MVYKNRDLCKIRTITTFLTLTKDKNLWDGELKKACEFCLDLTKEFNKNSYEVQTIRIVTNAFSKYLNLDSLFEAKNDLQLISDILDKYSDSNLRIRFAIGEAQSSEELAILPELIRDFGDLCNACVNIGIDENSILDNELIKQSAIAVKRISKITTRGEGNFNFTVNFNCKEYIPYFPASYHNGNRRNSYVIGYETPDLLVEVLKDFQKNNKTLNHNDSFDSYYKILHEALQYHVDNTKTIIEGFKNSDFEFIGIDSSAAPSKNCSSMIEVYRLLGVKNFGNSGSIEVSSFLTKVFKSVNNLPLIGFSGLMLAVIEDLGLAQGATKNRYDIRTLLTNSAVCGIGLDTVPIPGKTSVKKISALMRDTGTLAFRLNKPLTVRLFPIVNKKAGEMTEFESDDLCNCAILKVF